MAWAVECWQPMHNAMGGGGVSHTWATFVWKRTQVNTGTGQNMCPRISRPNVIAPTGAAADGPSPIL